MSITRAWIFGLASAFLLLEGACLPSFEDVECYSALDCPPNSTCMDGRCVGPGADGGTLDGSIPGDGGPSQDLGVERDLGPNPDLGAGADANVGADAQADGGLNPDVGPSPDATPSDTGVTVDAAVVASPSPLDFGDVTIGCTPPVRTISVENRTTAAMTLNGATVGGGGSSPFSVLTNSFPLSVPASSSENISVSFNPTREQSEVDQLLVGHSSVGSPLFVGLEGRGVARAEISENFTQLPGSIDILLVVDDSASMSALQTQLGQQLAQMFTALDAGGWDFQVGVTTTDVTVSGPQGSLVGTPAIITNATPNAESLLGQRVLVGTNGSGDEQGLEAAYLALAGAAPTGFVRTSAALLVLYLSDEADHSPRPTGTYAAQINDLKSDPSHAYANSIVGTAAAGCMTQGGSNAEYGPSFIAVSQATQGVVTNICLASWTPAITTFPELPRYDNFTLTGTPDASTISVFVNGQAVPSSSWSYNAANRRVTFNANALPPYGATIEIRFSTGC